MTFQIKILFICVIFLAAANQPSAWAQSENPSADVIQRIKNAYGGKRLQRLNNVTIKSDRRLAWPGQGQTADFVEFVTDRQVKHLDLKNKWGSVERWISQNGGIYHNQYLFNADGTTTIDYSAMTYTYDPQGSYFQSFGGDYRSSDTLLAHLLITNPPEISHRGQTYYDGRLVDTLSFQITPETPAVTIYVAQNDGLIRRLDVDRGFGPINIIFATHQTRKGITYASENRTYLDGRLVEYESGLSLIPNQSIARALKPGAGLSPAPEMVDLSEMTVDRLAQGVYQVGHGDYSMFIEDNGRYIAVNAYAGLQERYEALVKSTGKRLPLSHLVVTHHHSDHMDGIDDAVRLGATLLITGETAAVLQAAGKASAPSQQLTDGATIGPLKVYLRPTLHSAENAFVYHTTAKILFQDDHYHGLVKDGPTWVQPSAVELYQIFTDLGIEIDRILSGHARKAEKWADFKRGVARTFPGNMCPSQRQICQDQ